MNYIEFKEESYRIEIIENLLKAMNHSEHDFVKNIISAIDLRINELEVNYLGRYPDSNIIRQRIDNLGQIKTKLESWLNLQVFS